MQKILATLGPSSLTEQGIRKITDAGVDILRLNMSHVAYDDLEAAIDLVQRVTDTPLCIDSEGAQIRNTNMENGSVYYPADALVTIHHENVTGNDKNIAFSPAGISRLFEVGDELFIDFDQACLRVEETTETHLTARVISPGEVGSRKATNLSRKIELPAITEKDEKAIALGRSKGIRHYALSFAGCSEHVDRFRQLAGEDSFIISKVESRNGLTNLKGILESSDAILIDRGDLSREVPLTKIPFLQRRVISMARIFDTPVYVATNLLESMVTRREPTRAEVNDVVSTLLMGADGLVLAAETAVGHYPWESVAMISNLIRLCRKWTPNTTINEVLEIDAHDTP